MTDAQVRFSQALAAVVKQNGRSILQKPRELNTALTDKLPALENLRSDFLFVLQLTEGRMLLSALEDNAADLSQRSQALAHTLVESYYYPSEDAAYYVNLLLFAYNSRIRIPGPGPAVPPPPDQKTAQSKAASRTSQQSTGRKKKSRAPMVILLLLIAAAAYIVLGTDLLDHFRGPKFSDVDKDAYYYESLERLLDKGLISGTSEDTFSPQGNISRAAFLSILWNNSGAPECSDADLADFAATVCTDLSADQWYANAIYWGYENQLLTPDASGQWRPDDNLTYAQMFTFLRSYANLLGYSTVQDTVELPDSSTIPEWAVPAIQWAYANELFSDTSTDFSAPVTRERLVVILDNFLSLGQAS